MIVYTIFLLFLHQANAAFAQNNADSIYDFFGNLKDDIHGFYNGNLTVPCLPETRGTVVKITSYREKDAETYFEISSNRRFTTPKNNYELDYSTYTYNPAVGFTFHNVRNMPLTILCYNSSSEYGESVPFEFQITLTEPYKLHEPIIRSKTHGHVLEGEELEVICAVRTKNNYFKSTLYWNITDESSDRKYSYETQCDQPDDEYCVEILTVYIEKAQKHDSAIYQCVYEGLPNKTINTSYRITVLAPNEHYLILESPHVDTSNGTTLEVSFRGYPQPILYWYNVKGGKMCNKKKIEYKPNKVTLKLPPQIRIGFQNVTLIASNGFDKKKIVFKQKASVRLDTQIIIM